MKTSPLSVSALLSAIAAILVLLGILSFGGQLIAQTITPVHGTNSDCDDDKCNYDNETGLCKGDCGNSAECSCYYDGDPPRVGCYCYVLHSGAN